MSDKWISDEDLDRILKDSSVPEQAEDEEIYEEPVPQLEVTKMNLEEFVGSERNDLTEPNFAVLHDVPVEVRVILGSIVMDVEEFLALKVDSVIKLTKLAGEPVEIMIGEHVIAKGEAVIIDDRFGVLITDIIPPRERVRTAEKKLRR